MTQLSSPRVGISVIVANRHGQFLAGLRQGSHGADTWATAGGHLEFGEGFLECAARELMEETGLQLQQAEVLTVANHFFDEGRKHYVTVFCIGLAEGVPENREPHKCKEWVFFEGWGNFPQPSFVNYVQDVPQALIDAYKARHHSFFKV